MEDILDSLEELEGVLGGIRINFFKSDIIHFASCQEFPILSRLHLSYPRFSQARRVPGKRVVKAVNGAVIAGEP